MKLITGNLLDIRSGTILHQVNCHGFTGGLAGALYKKWPAAFDPYFARCEQPRALGSFVIGQVEPGLHIGHVFGQFEGGPCTDILAVAASLKEAHWLLDGAVYAPYMMGCGIGGGDWAKYQQVFEEWIPDITIVQRPEDAARG